MLCERQRNSKTGKGRSDERFSVKLSSDINDVQNFFHYSFASGLLKKTACNYKVFKNHSSVTTRAHYPEEMQQLWGLIFKEWDVKSSCPELLYSHHNRTVVDWKVHFFAAHRKNPRFSCLSIVL